MGARVGLISFLVLALLAPTAAGQDRVDLLLALLQKKGILSEQEVRELRSQMESGALEESATDLGPAGETAEIVMTPEQQVPAPQPAADSSVSVSDRFKFSGDLRLRYDHHERNVQGVRLDGTQERYRLRFGAQVLPTDNTRVGFRLTSGSGIQNSANQSMDGFGRGNSIFIDRAYAAWDPARWLEIIAGKHENPLFTTALVWDPDVSMQGLSEILTYSGETAQITGTLTQFLMEDIDGPRGQDGDPVMLAFQARLKSAVLPGAGLDLGITGYDFLNMDMFTAVGMGRQEDFVGYNNLNGQQMVFDANRRLLNDWRVLEFNAAFRVKNALAGQPLRLFGTYVRNYSSDIRKLQTEGAELPLSDPSRLAAYGDDDRDTAYLIGAELGFDEKKGDLKLRYAYQLLEDYAFPAVWVDSDFHGGGTNNRGHRASAHFFLHNKIELLGNLFFARRDNESKDGRRDENRLQLDLTFDF